MNMRHLVALAVGLTFTTANLFSQGSLTPPGAPEPTMKTLDQIEPRIPIAGGTGLGSFIITTPGSYYLTGEREVGGTPIFIRTNRVTIDLNGFALRRTPGAQTGSGIQVDGSATAAYQNITIRNGAISGFGYGIRLNGASACLVENVTVTDVGNIAFYAAGNGTNVEGNIFRNCSAVRAAVAGFYLEAGSGDCRGNLLLNCSASGSPGDGSVQAGVGFWLFGASSASGGKCYGNIIQSCSAAGNLRHGFALSASASVCQGNKLMDCVSAQNGTNGFYLQGTGLIGNLVQNCQAISNGANGILLQGSTGTAWGNKLANNLCIANGQRGISTSGSDGGLTIGNLCFTNNLGNFSLDTTDFNGPIVSTIGTLGTTGADAHPHANYSRP